MKKIGNIFYVVICLLLCIFPFAGMAFAPADTTTENRELAGIPDIREDDGWNRTYLQELGTYFEEHFAFRPLLVTVDSVIQSRVFEVSNMDTVIVGTDGWLYYTATLDDYLGRNTLSERGIYNVAHNLSLMQRYVEDKGAAFLFTAAPNKNFLYGENMPYFYKKKVSSTRNMTLLEQKLKEFDIAYADLSTAFADKEEILYLKRDSHWNRKGAVLAYNTLLDYLDCEHDTFETVGCVRTRTEYGDLNKMMYPVDFAPEWDYNYQNENVFTYVTDTESVEDAWIQTENPAGEGSLLMFRDSFGNTLLPLMADVFKDGYFSKSVPYNIEDYLNAFSPECVIVEKVERNIGDFATEPPIMTGPLVSLESKADKVSTGTTLYMAESEYNTAYWEISGMVDEKYIKTDTDIYINVTVNGETKTYEAYSTTKEGSDNGYLLYIAKKQIPSDEVWVEILLQTKGAVQSVAAGKFNVS